MDTEWTIPTLIEDHPSPQILVFGQGGNAESGEVQWMLVSRDTSTGPLIALARGAANGLLTPRDTLANIVSSCNLLPLKEARAVGGDDWERHSHLQALRLHGMPLDEYDEDWLDNFHQQTLFGVLGQLRSHWVREE